MMNSNQAVFELGEYRCVSGKTIQDVRIGYETYGTLRPEKDNAIMVCHYFSGNAHAAGPESDTNPLPGWWDTAIGPGKVLDTDRYYIVVANSLANLNACDGHTITTGPASLNADTGKAYVYHDPCYLGRHNSLYDEPRAAIDAIPGIKRIEMEGDCRDRSFCCGGGGLMLFYEPEEEQRMGVLRVEMAKKAGANVIVTACPFCLVNIEDAIKVAGLEGEMEAIDLCELVEQHLANDE